jgi:hypothetical protein
MSAQPLPIRDTGAPSAQLLVGLPIALYNGATLALLVHLASGWMFGLRLAYLGFLCGAAIAVVGALVGVIDVIGAAPAAARRTVRQQQAVSLGAGVAYGAAGYLLYRSYQARFLLDGPDLRYVPALVLAAIALTGAIVVGWVAWKVSQGRHADQRS